MWGDVCSLVPGRLDNHKWSLTAPLMAPRLLTQAAVSSRTGLRSLVAVNYDSRSPAGGRLALPFTVPDGVTAVRLTLSEVSLYGATASPGPLELTLLDATGSIVLHTTSYQPTSETRDVWTVDIAVTPGTEYIACLTTRTAAGHAVFQCGRYRVVPSVYIDRFWSNFTRIEAHPSLLHGSNRYHIDQPRYWRQRAQSFLKVRTDGNELRAEYIDTAGVYLQSHPNAARPAAFVFGEPIDPPPALTSRATNIVRMTLPLQGTKVVEIHSGVHAATIYPAPHNENIGTYLAAIYVPASSAFEVLTDGDGAAEKIVLYGDSKISAYHTDLPASDGPAVALRRRGYRVTCHCAGGWSLFADATATLSVDACFPLARRLTRGSPDRIVLQMGRNDFANGKYTPANLVTQLGNLLDAINEVAPGVMVDLHTFTREVTEDDVSATTWEAERAAIAALVTPTRAKWVTLVETARAWTKAQAALYTDSDEVHPNKAGYQRIVQAIEGGDFPYSPLDSGTCLAYVEGSDLLTGGSYGTITATGLTPPTITLSGAPSWANQIRIAINTTGPVGASDFSVSFDQGRSWPIRGIKTATAVLLEGLGITIGFPAGTYYNNNVYTAETTIGQWGDKSGNGRHMVSNTGQLTKYSPSKAHGKAGVTKNTGTNFMRILGLNVPAPYTMMVVGKCLSQATVKTLIGKTIAGSGGVLYTATSATVAYNDGVGNIAMTIDATVRRSYFVGVNGASSFVRSSGLTTNGTTGNVTLTGVSLYADGAGGWAWDDEIDFWGLWSGVMSTDEMVCLEARARKLWGAV